MLNIRPHFPVLALVACFGCSSEDPGSSPWPHTTVAGLPSRIGFGSCSDPRGAMPVMDVAADLDLDLFLFLGDNVYIDSLEPEQMRARYAELAAAPEFRRLARTTELIATWDDHDYGQNDAGKELPSKAASKRAFLDFWREPASSPRWDHPGIYTSSMRDQDGLRLQVLVLDTRWFRDPLKPNDGGGKNAYLPDPDPSLTLLGGEQWAWLEAALREPASLRIIMSSIQLAHEHNGWESWTNLPAEQQRMLELLATTQAGPVLFVSGDVHWGEMSRREIPGGTELWDITSSGITETWPTLEPNRYRVGAAVRDNNIGLLEVDWEALELQASLYDATGTERTSVTLGFDQLRF